jgi:protein-S-isoprenylcysteine O-methyltransferase Ste14
MTASLGPSLVFAYHLASRLAYVLYVGLALSAEERGSHFTKRWGVEGGFLRFRRIAALVMNNDGVSFVVLCLVSWGTLGVNAPRLWVAGLGALLLVTGVGTKVWAAATLGARAYYWHDFFAPAPKSPTIAGPYRLLRNPMYTAGYLPLYGLALVTLSLPGMLAAVFDHAAILAFYRWVEKPHFERLSEAKQDVPVTTSSHQRADTTLTRS